MCSPTDTPASPCARVSTRARVLTDRRARGHRAVHTTAWFSGLWGVFVSPWIEQPALFWDLGVGRGAGSTLKCLWQNSPKQERRQAVLRRKSPEQLQPSPALGPRGNISPRRAASELPALEVQEGAAGLQVPSTRPPGNPGSRGLGAAMGSPGLRPPRGGASQLGTWARRGAAAVCARGRAGAGLLPSAPCPWRPCLMPALTRTALCTEEQGLARRFHPGNPVRSQGARGEGDFILLLL